MLQAKHAWTFEHSVDCGVPAEFALSFWTNVSNWALDPDVESVELHGPFAAGSRGVTKSQSSGRVERRVIEVQPGKAVIEFPLSEAVGTFGWTFEDIGGSTRITQRCTLDGKQADVYAKAVGPGLGAGVPAGMQKLCGAMEKAARDKSPDA